MALSIWTVGHSNRSSEQLVEMLVEAGIAAVADVRSSPWSRRHPWHGRDEMERILGQAGIAYHWLGASLGGLQDGGYAAHRRGEAYRQGLDRLMALAAAQPTALLCAEADPRSCHRKFIADDLSRRGLLVRHLLGPGQSVPHQPSLFAE